MNNVKIGDSIVCVNSCRGATFKKEKAYKGKVYTVSKSNNETHPCKTSSELWLSEFEGLFNKRYFKPYTKWQQFRFKIINWLGL